MQKKITHKIKNFLLNFLQTQLIVTIVALPILVSWGLSTSLMTFAGNLLFSPILTIFLMLSSMVFFTELLQIPNDWIIVCLDKFTHYWDNILAHGSADWLIEFCKPPALVLIAIPVITFLILHFGKFKTAGARIGVMGSILTVCMLGFWSLSFLPPQHPLILFASQNTRDERQRENPATPIHSQIRLSAHPCFDTIALPAITQHERNVSKGRPTGTLDIQQNPDGTLNIIDYGYFSRRPSPEKAIEFELKPYLVKKFGKIRIRQLVVKRPGQRNFMAAKALCSLFQVSQVVLEPIEKKLTKGGELALAELTRLLEEKGIERSPAVASSTVENQTKDHHSGLPQNRTP